ncbi:MAG: molybdopterin-dependent oxidoreductase [Anaerolineales bacterium]|nr:molybdopterin-dependent oxidoreductase [Anaerolineales bacterium]
MPEHISLVVNGQAYTLEIIPGEKLSSLLRNRLRLTGTKVGCGEGKCGACTVYMDGRAVVSCLYPAKKANGKHILTIEGLTGLAPDQLVDLDLVYLHPLQEAFIKHGAVQCGFCIPGQIMAAYALLKHNPDPDSGEIRNALKNVLCRCAGYPTIERAILSAAHSIRTGEAVELASVQQSAASQRLIGQSQIRPDAVAKVTGAAVYTDDLIFDGMLYASVRRAGVPHAFLHALDISRAASLPGVHAVLTARDIPGQKNHGLFVYDWPIMVGIGERVRYVGDALAIVAAETEEIARQAAALIHADFDPQPVVTGPLEALQPGAPVLHEDGNLLKHIKVRKGDIAAGFARADVVQEHTFYTPMTEHAFLEPECSIAAPTGDGRLEIYVGSQIPYSDRKQIALALGFPEEKIRIVGQLMGGGFGGKEDIAGQIHAALLANATGQPVKLLFDRKESLLVHPKRHATQIMVRAGMLKSGRLVAVQTELYGDTGAYASLGEKVMARATTHSTGPYDIAHVRADCFAMYTNNPPAGAFRGFGVTQSAFAVESLMDMLAEKLGIDPIELRKLNALRVGSTTSTGQLLRESVGLVDCIEKVEAEMLRTANKTGVVSRAQLFDPFPVPGKPDLVRAWGFAAAFKNTGLGGGAPDKSGAEVELLADGALEVRTSAAELGQGLVSVLQMIVAEEFSVRLGQVRVLLMDTDLTPDGGPTTASRQTFVTGNAARLAARALRASIVSWLVEMYDQPPESIQLDSGAVRLNVRSIPLAEVARAMRSQGRQPKVLYEYHAPGTRPLGEGGEMHFAFGFAAQAAEVEVNKQTGAVRVIRIIAATDVGQIMNPLGLQGQVEGGVMMGLGNALTEEFLVRDGQVSTDLLARYGVPGIMMTPEITSLVVEHPIEAGPYGAKGIGEIVSIPTTPAITNAIYRAVGIRIDRLPASKERIRGLLNEGRGAELN